MSEKKKKLQSPVCQWGQCQKTFENVELLYQHTCKVHTPEIQDDIKPTDRIYKCSWKGCNKTFHKIKLLHSHVRDHCGSLSDSFFEVLLADQSKALSQPATSMKWHPLVIKWCLRTWNKSHSIHKKS